MGTFYTECRIENPVKRTKSATIPKHLVNTHSECTWAPEALLDRIGIKREKKDLTFVMANGQQVTRSVGFAIIRVDGYFTIDEVVFAEKGDLLILGARTLEGLNLTVDSTRKKLIAAGPIPAATAVRTTCARRLRRWVTST
jgi:predicted aspartyl protease